MSLTSSRQYRVIIIFYVSLTVLVWSVGLILFVEKAVVVVNLMNFVTQEVAA